MSFVRRLPSAELHAQSRPVGSTRECHRGKAERFDAGEETEKR